MARGPRPRAVGHTRRSGVARRAGSRRQTVRNSATPGGVNVKLFSALLHHEQVVIAQITVPQDTTEVTCVPDLLNQVDLTGKTVTLDAAHTQDATADYLTRVRGAGYIMTVKGNRPHLMEAIAARMPRAYTGSADHTDEEIAGGQRVVREIWVTTADGIDFPGAAQVFQLGWFAPDELLSPTMPYTAEIVRLHRDKEIFSLHGWTTTD